MGLKVWRDGEPGQPAFPTKFDVVKKAVLQCADLTDNHNKYYAIEIHSAGGNKFRVYTHYGRTDDLETNPNAGRRECRYCGSLGEAEAEYASIYKQKNSKRKGYQEVHLASSKIDSQQSVGKSCGTVDAKTLQTEPAEA